MQSALPHHQAGRFEAAEALYTAALAVSGKHPDALHLLGVLHFQRGDNAKAIELIDQAVAASPDTPAMWSNLALARKGEGDLDGARTALERALVLKPEYPEALNNLGLVLQEQGDHPGALSAFECAVGFKADYAEALSNLGGARMKLGDLPGASDALKSAIETDGSLVQAWRQLGSVNLALAEPEAAAEALAQVAVLEPTPVARRDVGVAHLQAGRLDAAAVAFQAARQQAPQWGRPLLDLGQVKAACGEVAEAEILYREALSDPQLEAEAWSLLTDLGAEVDAGRMQALAESGGLNRPISMLCHALGHLAHRAGEPDRAFDWYTRGNTLRRTLDEANGVRYNAQARAADAVRLSRTFTAERLATPGGAPSEQPIFIVGPMRSGTTLVEQILSAHSEVAAAGESYALGQAVRRTMRVLARAGHWPESVTALPGEALAMLGQGYLDALIGERPERQVATRITDKMPSNLWHVGLAAMILPRARFILCQRDPFDVGLSMFRQHFNQTQAHSHTLHDIGQHLIQTKHLADHWQAALGDRIYTVDFERLVTSPQTVIPSLIEFCGLPWEDACLSPETNQRAVLTASQQQVRRAIDPAAVGQWRAYASHLEPLKTSLGRVDAPTPPPAQSHTAGLHIHR